MTPEIITSIMASIGMCVFFVAGYMLGKTDAERKRLWVGLTDEDWDEIFGNALTIGEAIKVTEAKLKEKNSA